MSSIVSRHPWLRKVIAVVVVALALVMVAISSWPPGALMVVAALPPRPTPAITPLPTPTPLPKPAQKQETAPVPLSHILLTVTPLQGGLWTAVEWQGEDGAWHGVAGWQGTLMAGRQRWAVFARNFGQGPFRWVVYAAADKAVLGTSAPFHLPKTNGEELLIRVKLDG